MYSITNHTKIIIMAFTFCLLLMEESKAQTEQTWIERIEQISFRNIPQYSDNQLLERVSISKEKRTHNAVSARKTIVPDFFTFTILIVFAFDKLKLFSKWTIRLGYLAAGLYLLAQSHIIAYCVDSCSLGNWVSSVASMLLFIWLAVICLQLNKLKTE